MDASFESMHASLHELRSDLRAGFAVIVFLLVLLISNFFHSLK